MENTQETQLVKRWTDHWQVKALLWAMALMTLTAVSGATWTVSEVISAKEKNVEQDGRIKPLEDRLERMDVKLDKIDDKLDSALRGK